MTIPRGYFCSGVWVPHTLKEVHSRGPEDAKAGLQPIILTHEYQWPAETSILFYSEYVICSLAYTVPCSSTASKQIHHIPEMSPNNPCVSTRQPRLCWMGGCDDGTWLDYEIGKACLSSIVELSLSAWSTERPVGIRTRIESYVRKKKKKRKLCLSTGKICLKSCHQARLVRMPLLLPLATLALDLGPCC